MNLTIDVFGRIEWNTEILFFFLITLIISNCQFQSNREYQITDCSGKLECPATQSPL